jgi:asparagine synthase (glutamine-hydrolysing)
MPGIVGIIGKNKRPVHREHLRLMLECMLHEPWYSFGEYVDEKMHVYAGWVCHEGSFCDCMPVRNEKGDVTLLFSGESYQSPELLDSLKRKKHDFNRDNADFLVHLYEEKENDFPRSLNGCFSGLVVDNRKGEVLLFNDRFGQERVHFYEDKEAFYFSSEAKSILKLKPEARRFDKRGLGEWLAFQCVLENRSLYKGVSILPGASTWVFNRGVLEGRRTYFDVGEWEAQSFLEKDLLYDKLRTTFRKILPSYFTPGGKVALSLTAGLDTRIILANLDTASLELPCYTFSGPYRKNYDSTIAGRIASACGQEHTIIRIGEPFFNDFKDLASKTIYISDGYFDITGAAELYANRIARQIAPIRVTGNYGSEALRGMSYLRPNIPRHRFWAEELDFYIDQAVNTLRSIRDCHPLTLAVFKEGPWLENNRTILERSQLVLRTPYLDNEFIDLLYRASPEVRQNSDLSHRLIADGDRLLAAIKTDLGVRINGTSLRDLPGRLFRELLFKADYVFNYGMPQWLTGVDRLMRPFHLERIFLGRHKVYHFRVWYRDELSSYVEDVLLDRRSLGRDLFSKKNMEHIVRAHLSGKANFTGEITILLTLELAQRLLMDGSV